MWRYFEPSRPREAKGGIRARSRRGAFGETWWGRRWMETLESFGLESRLARGRSYARGGQVLAIEVKKGGVAAQVQGSRPKPYDVTIRAKALADSEWDRVIAVLAARPLFATGLLSGEMPAEIETALAAEDLSLFPRRTSDLQTGCSCPDFSNPCKHLAAVYCLLAEEFDRDPFLLLALRGREREEIVAALVGRAAANEDTAEDISTALPPEPLAADPRGFWEGTGEAPLFPGHVHPPPVAAPLVRRLGPFPFWRGAEPLPDAVVPLCRSASERALRRYLGEES